MKKQKRYLFVAVVMASLFLSGCGTELFEMTKEEEDLIVHSAAYYVAKHNIQQKDGASAVVDPDSIVLQEETTESTEVPDVENGDDVTGALDGANTEGQEADDTTMTLAKAVGHAQDLTITYSGSEIADNFVEGDAYVIDASNGKTFYIMKFVVANTTDADVLLDNVSLNPLFKLVGKDVNVKAEVTFLARDFSTYLGTISAGECVEMVLLFEISESQAEQISTAVLQIIVNNEIKSIKL